MKICNQCDLNIVRIIYDNKEILISIDPDKDRYCLNEISVNNIRVSNDSATCLNGHSLIFNKCLNDFLIRIKLYINTLNEPPVKNNCPPRQTMCMRDKSFQTSYINGNLYIYKRLNTHTLKIIDKMHIKESVLYHKALVNKVYVLSSNNSNILYFLNMSSYINNNKWVYDALYKKPSEDLYSTIDRFQTFDSSLIYSEVYFNDSGYCCFKK